jgi:hypothetical protein
MDLKGLLAKLSRMWDPRPHLAKDWLECAQKYEESLRANKLVDPQIVDSILQERKRIHALFQKLLPEFKDQISIVITNDVCGEHCAIFSWNNHIYVLVSAALIGRPIDHPESNGIKAWDWLAHHEISHLKSGHLPWLFHVRRLFRLTILFLCSSSILSYVLPSNSLTESWLNTSLWLFGFSWCIQTIVSLIVEYKADLQATRSIADPLILEDAEKALSRMGSQAIRRFPQPLGWLNYLLSLLFSDPHPPFVLRQWLLRKHAQLLKNDLEKPAVVLNND